MELVFLRTRMKIGMGEFKAEVPPGLHYFLLGRISSQ